MVRGWLVAVVEEEEEASVNGWVVKCMVIGRPFVPARCRANVGQQPSAQELL